MLSNFDERVRHGDRDETVAGSSIRYDRRHLILLQRITKSQIRRVNVKPGIVLVRWRPMVRVAVHLVAPIVGPTLNENDPFSGPTDARYGPFKLSPQRFIHQAPYSQVVLLGVSVADEAID